MNTVLKLSMGVLLLGIAQPADAASKCGSLEGTWDAYVVLSQLVFSELPAREPFPPTAARCSLAIDRAGQVQRGVNCTGVFAGEEVEVFVEGFDLTLDRNCRLSPDALLHFEVQTPLIQTQDIYFCRPEATLVRGRQSVIGLLACGHVPEQFSMVKR